MFEIFVEKNAHRDLLKISHEKQHTLLKKIYVILGQNRFPQKNNPKKLRGEKVFRLRIGEYRVLYKIHQKRIFVFAIRHRKDTYR